VKSHDVGVRSRVGQPPPEDGLLMIQGPLALDWGRRKMGIIPRIENGDLHASLPPAIRRLALWKSAQIHVAGRPDWLFVKLHTHGCKDGNIDTLLGPQYQQFHRDLAAHTDTNPQTSYYYVTAWEMARLVNAAEANQPLESVLGSPVSSSSPI